MFLLGLLNISNILCVTVNPPPMLMEEMKAAMADKDSMVFVGVYPPPIRRSPPTAVIPEIALVTDISGE